MEIRYVEIVVEGKVQGVFFRKHTQQFAQGLSLTGFVCNKRNGSVYIVAGGPHKEIQQLITWCNTGPKQAVVTAVKVADVLPQVFDGFEIRNADY